MGRLRLPSGRESPRLSHQDTHVVSRGDEVKTPRELAGSRDTITGENYVNSREEH